jgi:hypothetical protein
MRCFLFFFAVWSRDVPGALNMQVKISPAGANVRSNMRQEVSNLLALLVQKYTY